MRKYLVLFILTAVMSPVIAQYSYMPGDREVDLLMDAYAAGGRVFPETGFPLSRKELKEYALRIGAEQVLELVDYDSGQIEFSEALALNFRQVFRTREDWFDFSRLYLDTPDFFTLILNAQDNDLGGLFIRAGVKAEYDKNDLFKPNNLPPSREGNPVAAENGVVREGYFYYLLDSLELALGRKQIHYGAGNFSTLYVSRDIPFVDGFFYNFNLGPLQMQSYFATLENRKADMDFDDAGSPLPANASFEDNILLATMHRFEYAWEKVRLGVGAQMFVVRAENGFQLGDIFPVFSWHNGYVGENNMSMILDVSYTPLPGLELYFMGGTDDINASDLMGVNDSELPTIPAWILGTVYQPLFTNLVHKIRFEAGKTHYLWGNFHWDEGDDQNAFARAIYRYKMDKGTVAIPMTSPYGPGASWAELDVHLGTLKGIIPQLRFLYLSQIDGLDLLNDNYYRDDEAMDDAARNRVINAGLTLSYQFTEWGLVSLDADLFSRNGELWFESSLGFKLESVFSQTMKSSP